MPANAMASMDIDHCVLLAELGPLLTELAHEPSTSRPPKVPPNVPIEDEFARGGGGMEDLDKVGQPSTFTCPACRGALWEVWEGGALVRFRCHTGHAFSGQTLLSEQGEAVETALFSSLRAIEEKAALLRKMSEQLGNRLPHLHESYGKRASELEVHAATLRRLLPGMAS